MMKTGEFAFSSSTKKSPNTKMADPDKNSLRINTSQKKVGGEKIA